MNGASKILTVSYGTFSCTLEGFDDPFNTMKAIAEYFRDLAAEDRYFGAEPPTPDAAMLHRIAEREIQRRVEAKVGEHGIVLRADAAAVSAPADAVVSAPVEATVAPAPAEAAPAPILATPAEAAPAVESAAARLHRLRQVQAQMQTLAPIDPAPAAPRAEVPVADLQAYVEDQEAEPAARPEPAALPEMTAPDMLAPEPAAPAEDQDNPVDRVLTALRDEPAERVEAEAEEADAPVLSSLRETLAGLMPQDDQLAEDMARAEAEAPVLLSAEDLPEDAAPLAETVEEVTAFAAPEAEPEAEVEIEIQADVIDAALTMPAPLADDAAFAAPDEPVAASAELALADEAPAADAPFDADPDVVISEAAPIVAEKLQRARARVIKIRRLDRSEPAPTVLSPEDEADLQNTLDALAVEASPAPVVAEAAPDAAGSPLARTADASVDRLLAQTNQQLDVPETKRRRSAIAHLKAAVLATVADRRNSPKAKEEESEAKADPYRQDLGKVVRPLAGATPGERPAPLVLVSAQRIDRKPDAGDANRPMPQIVSSSPAGLPVPASLSVRPRRITSTGGLAQAQVEVMDEDAEADEDFGAVARYVAEGGKQSFAEFAGNLGAASLSELLEAAGAYCTLVLDRPSFSRPLLFQQVTQLPAMADAKREDSLRNFGKLLREGRFQKTVRGQFALSETSPILTEAKRLAG